MKKNYMKWSGFLLTSAIMLSSCMSEVEAPVANEMSKALDESTEVVSGGENLRKGPNGVFYQEKFSNQSIRIPERPEAFPGFGEGQATYIGNGFSFFNQYAMGFPDDNGVVFTTAAPVTEFFKDQLIAMGIDTDEIDANPTIVSSLTSDGKGNTIWFNNVSNQAQFDAEENITFEAEIEIVGGTGKFKGATGTGTVIGNVSGVDGKGTTTVRANIVF